MNRREFSRQLALGAAGIAAIGSGLNSVKAEPGTQPAQVAGSRPVPPGTDRLNVLLIVSDDLPAYSGCYGNPYGISLKTPNMDRLAARGVLFENAFCQSALCNPSRSSFLSGLRPDTTGVHDLVTPTRQYLKDWVFLPQHFRLSGYYSAKLGKVYHTGDGPSNESLGSDCEDPLSWDTDIREWGKRPWPDQITVGGKDKEKDQDYRSSWGWDKLSISDEETPDGVVARLAAGILDKYRPMDKPLFLAVGFRRPHDPYAAPQKYYDLYPADQITLPEEPDMSLQCVPRAALTYDPDKPEIPPKKRREGIAAKYASISFADAQLGLLLDVMDRNNLWDNTVVVLTADHGYHLGEHGGMWHKISNFDEAARVPLIIAAPGMKANARCSRVVESLDLYPTLAQLAGVSLPAGLQGASLVPLLEDPQQSWDRPAFTQIQRPAGYLDPNDGKFMGRSIRTERWRYTEWDDGKKGVQLYDISKDPREYVNLAKDPKYLSEFADTVNQLRTQLHDATASWPKAAI
jgi:iduronate 2-sulfatase